jgi:hypothetical protein
VGSTERERKQTRERADEWAWKYVCGQNCYFFCIGWCVYERMCMYVCGRPREQTSIHTHRDTQIHTYTNNAYHFLVGHLGTKHSSKGTRSRDGDSNGTRTFEVSAAKAVGNHAKGRKTTKTHIHAEGGGTYPTPSSSLVIFKSFGGSESLTRSSEGEEQRGWANVSERVGEYVCV